MIIIENSTADIFSLIAFLFFFIIMPILRANKKKNQEKMPSSKKPKSLQEMIKEAMQSDEEEENDEAEVIQYPVQNEVAEPVQEKILEDEQETLIGKPALKSDLQIFMEKKAKQLESNRILPINQEMDKPVKSFDYNAQTTESDSIEFDAMEAMIYHEIFSMPKAFDYET